MCSEYVFAVYIHVERMHVVVSILQHDIYIYNYCTLLGTNSHPFPKTLFSVHDFPNFLFGGILVIVSLEDIYIYYIYIYRTRFFHGFQDGLQHVDTPGQSQEKVPRCF